jgi:hypothetical protein
MLASSPWYTKNTSLYHIDITTGQVILSKPYHSDYPVMTVDVKGRRIFAIDSNISRRKNTLLIFDADSLQLLKSQAIFAEGGGSILHIRWNDHYGLIGIQFRDFFRMHCTSLISKLVHLSL